MIKLTKIIFLGLLVFLSTQTFSSFAQDYTAEEIYSTGFENLTANALSDNGKVVGINNGQSTPGAFLWDSGTFTDLGAQYYNKAVAEGWDYAINTAMGVNNNDLVVGYATTQSEGNTFYRPLVWDDGEVTDIYYAWEYEGRALTVNNNDQVVLATYNNGASNVLDILNWNTLEGRGIPFGGCSSCPQIIGFAMANDEAGSYEWGPVVGKIVHPDEGTHGFYWNNGTSITTLGSLGNGQSYSVATDINNTWKIVGTSGSGNDTPISGDIAFSWENGVMSSLGMLPGADSSAAFAINGSGLIVGTSGGKAVLWKDGQIIDLNDLLNLANLTLTSALDINSEGQILALAEREDGSTVNLLLTPALPIPEPSAFWQFLIAGGLLAWFYLRKNTSTKTSF